MQTRIHAAGPNGQRSPGLDAAIAAWHAENPGIGGGVELVSGTVDLDGTGSPVREFYCTGAATIEGVAFAAGTAVVFRRTPVGVWGYIVVDDWTDIAGTTTTTTTAATTTTTTTEATTTTTTTSNSPYVNAVLADDPFAYWRFEETGGTSLADSSGNGHVATLASGDLNVAGARGSAVSYTGTPDHSLHTTLGSLFGDLAVTGLGIELWIKTSTSAQDFVMGAVNTGTTMLFALQLNTNVTGQALEAGSLFIQLRTGEGSNKRYAVPSSGLMDGQWHHLVISLAPGIDSLPAVYIDGSSRTVDAAATNAPGGSYTALEFPLAIGARNIRGVMGDHFTGQVDEVAFYAHPLSAARALAHYGAAS